MASGPGDGGHLRDRGRDELLAAALRGLDEQLRPSTLCVYLEEPDGSLSATAILDTALGFAVTPALPAGDTRFVSVRAYREGRPVVRDPAQSRRFVVANPSFVQHVDTPMMAVAVPLRADGHTFGSISARWMHARNLRPATVDRMVEAASGVAVGLAKLSARHGTVEPPTVPLFVPEPGSARPPDGPRNSSRFLLQLQQLATELTAARQVRDVVAATYQELVRPFGGQGILLCLEDRGRLRAVGASGLSSQEVGAVDGLLLAEGSPEADAVLRSVSTIFRPGELAQAYPGLGRYDDEGPARAFLPMVADDRTVGCCVLVLDPDRVPRDDELAIVMIMLGQVSQSLKRIRLNESQEALIHGMQRVLLPRELPDVPGLESAARYLPAGTGTGVGGDWYDVVVLPGGQVGMIIGDVEGHNLDAVGTMGQMRSAVRAYAAEGHDPASVLTRSNRLLDELGGDLFVTCCCVWLTPETGVATMASAGHHEPAVTREDGGVVPTALPVGPPLGVAAGTVYRHKDVVVPPNAVVALFTDGLLDVRGRGAADAYAQVGRRIAAHAGEDLETLADRLTGTGDPPARQDDLALLLVRNAGSADGHRRVARATVHRHDVRRVAELRGFLRDLMAAWGHESLTDELETLMSEVVTNALIHAHSEVDVLLREYPDRLRAEVRDNDPRPPVPAVVLAPDDSGDGEAESGRGLLIVDALATAWGSSPAGRGKTTWFEMAVPETERGEGDERDEGDEGEGPDGGGPERGNREVNGEADGG
ncbi:SpoIIE family protein phosphatase [Streptantibioticus silvisoli]|uniref:SpoIIE family protein phosphatase n=1 Tax=Streptantibioticus silvisoli TaxID=2705255 RepID=A0ABT6WB32_9ACTN|nr:SpoIIE family protein phosphatase [Streptantibioticus silvisoli]MDI5967673.1 SpoIIE family protein phosphatase [Streptantibioticus silvisoli]